MVYPPAPAPVDGPPGQPGVHFQVGVATTATLDQRVWRKAWADAARQPVSGDYADPQGEADLRAALCAWTGRSRGCPPRQNTCWSPPAPCRR
ncbi:hypothetical protein ACFSC4_07895 [Deinococcus malanensis]|uniref:hypothetical protein n=1 Tax=Deinococcus malanensis TaxID=1706855 RepID=UPI003644FAD8